ncbi:hypothetical protein [Sphingobacterium siyangense]|uniref:hypothetical protein n=1 Tax=Sphingobacterium siyangense TaxID=459529 RepID=UPI003DA64B6A
MTKDHFLLEDKITEIESKFISPGGWIKIYEKENISADETGGVYCCLIANNDLSNYNDDDHWPLVPGSEGRPSVYGDNTYKSYDKDGLEPFLYYKSFSLPEKHISYLDISEEFILYFKLYEKGESKDNRIFYYVDDYGEMDEVIIVEPNRIMLKVKYIKEYITLREMYFVITCDYMRLLNNPPSDWDVIYGEELVKKGEIVYSHTIRNVMGPTQSWIMGKVFFGPNKEKKTHFDVDDNNQEFIIGHDDEGELLYENCGNTEGNHFKLTFFSKEVLNKYYNDPSKYEVDGFRVSSKYFGLKIDNNKTGYVPVFLTNLRFLPLKEQLHWKQYNLPPKKGMGMSNTYYTTMIEGNWAKHPETADLFFKSRYSDFNAKWEKKFGWKLYKPLSEKDKYLFTALHKITTNNIKAFCEQTLTIVKLTIDRINEKEISKGLVLDSKIRGIGKFEKYLEENGMVVPDLFEFLRNLQNLRSGLIAHTFSETNKDCKKALEYFNIKEDNLIEVSEEIFVKSIYTFNTLETYFGLDSEAPSSENQS